MEREKRRKQECEVARGRPTRSKSRRRSKQWAQVSLGVILGLILGLTTESIIFVTRGINVTDNLCRFTSEKSASSSASKITHRIGDPLKIINFEKSEATPHNSQENLVFVGVMTAQKYLSTRAVAVYETWGRELPGRIAFFTSESSKVPENGKDLPLVRLRKVDDSYPPQKKSFLMLQYIWQNYGDRFEWFIRADDDVYIRPDKLESFLRSVDSRKPLFIGQAGRGNQEEFGLLSLEYDENFCMGGPGIIFSRETLNRVAPHIKYCLKNLYTTHEDVELGRCVRKFANISCTWSYEMQTILYHNSSGYEAFTGNLKQKEVHRAITLHPVKQYQYMYKLHNYMRELRIRDLQYEIVLLHRDIKKVLELLSKNGERSYAEGYKRRNVRAVGDGTLGDIDMIGLEPSIEKFRADSEEDILNWDFIQRSIYSKGNFNPRRRIEAPYKEGIEDVIREFMEMINQYSRQRGRVIEYQDLLYGYSRVDPLHGADYILDMLLKYKKYRGRKMTVPVRRHAYLQQQFTGIEIRDATNEKAISGDAKTSTESGGLRNVMKQSLMELRKGFSPVLLPRRFGEDTTPGKKIINFILPLSGRYQTFLRFMKNYEEVCLINDGYTALVVVLFCNKKDDSDAKVKGYVEKLKLKYPTSSLRVIPVNEDFARAMALEIGAAYCEDDDANILFFIDVDMLFGADALERIRRNTIRGEQVYFPIIYSEFDPAIVYGNQSLNNPDFSPDHFRITPDTGYWRQFGFGIASLYKKDLRRVGGFDTSIRGWGKEDVDLYEKFISFSRNITIFRSADPSLVHVFHIVECDPNLELSQLNMCKGTRKDTYGNVNQLAHCIYSNPRKFKMAVNRKRKAS